MPYLPPLAVFNNVSLDCVRVEIYSNVGHDWTDCTFRQDILTAKSQTSLGLVLPKKRRPRSFQQNMLPCILKLYHVAFTSLQTHLVYLPPQQYA